MKQQSYRVNFYLKLLSVHQWDSDPVSAGSVSHWSSLFRVSCITAINKIKQRLPPLFIPEKLTLGIEGVFSWRQHGRAVWFSCSSLSTGPRVLSDLLIFFFFWIIEPPSSRPWENHSSHSDYFREQEQVLWQMLCAGRRLRHTSHMLP